MLYQINEFDVKRVGVTTDILTPISADKPCGEDARYDDAYIAVETEIDKAKSANAQSKVDWTSVTSQSEAILIKQTKDIKIACRLAFARFMIDGNDGLINGLETLKALLDKFGANLFPISAKAKINAFAWLEEEIGASLRKDGIISASASQSQTLLALFIGLRESVKSVCGDENIFFTEICQLLQSGRNESEAQNKIAQESKKPAENRYATARPEIANEADVTAALNAVKKQAAPLLSYWRGQNADDPRALRLSRAIAWLEIDDPPAAKDGVTALNPPNIETIERIDALIKGGKAKEALGVLEELIIKSPFWFEGHLRVYDILETLGKHSSAAMIKRWIEGFLKAFDGITSLSFKDGSEFVPSAVKAWLLDNDVDESAVATDKEKPAEDKLETARRNCFQLSRTNKIREALELIGHSCKESRSKEEEFRWKLLRVEVLFEAGKTEIALVLIDELEKEVQIYKLEEWRPDLVGQLYILTLKFPKRGLIGRERLESAYNALCRLDAAAALNIKPN